MVFMIINLIFMINFIRRFLADHVVYQSNYVKNIWEIYGGKLKNTSVIYNAVNLNEFFPVEKNAKSSEFSIVAVEGTVQGELALRALKSMTSIKINVYGRVHKMIKNALQISNNKNVILHGSIPREDIPKIFVGKKIYLCLEINPACPNSVIEALAAGVPVVGFNSGSLLELVGDAGVILPLENAGFKNFKDDDFKALNLAIEKIVGDYDYYSTLARTRSEKFYNLDDQFLKYKDLF